ncbi:MAG TPA: RDD family protein [Bacteroidia bacterium]|nr:RDD family protein [Bacteroidia bacterium]
MEQILDSPETSSSKNYAGFWIRFVAYLIDGLILYIFQSALMFLGIGSMFMNPEAFQDNPEAAMEMMGKMWGIIGISVFVGIVYFAGLESSAKQGTWGKQAMKLKVVDTNGNRLSFMHALGRYLSKIISAMILCIGFLMVAWDSKKQGLHDRIAGTLVLRD